MKKIVLVVCCALPIFAQAPVVRTFFGSGAPGSVAGNQPGSLYSDTTNHNIYQCNAASGTSAPACTSVTAGGWALLNGGAQVFPPAGIPLSTGSGFGSSYSTSGTGSVCLTVSCTMTTPALGTPSAITLTNGLGLPIAALTGLGTGVGTFLGTPSGANLAAALTSALPSSKGGTGVANTATLTLGTSNQNWASLGTGIVKNTTTTGAISDAAAADVVGLFSGCSGTQYLGADGNCHNAGTGSGNAASLQTVTFGSTPAFACPSSSAGTVVTFELSTALTANISPTISGCTNGQTVNFRLVQDATGGRTVTWPSGWTTLSQPSPVASTETTIQAVWDGTSGKGVASADSGPGVCAEQAAPGSPPSGADFTWCDSTGHLPRWKNNGGTIFQGSKELTAGNIRKAGGANTADSAAAASDIVALFSTCSGTQYLGADGACHDSGGGSSVPAFNVTTSSTVITMAAGTVGTAAAGYTVLSGTYTITFASGTDSGNFYVGVNDSSQPACWYGAGITIGHWTVVGFQGSTCTSGTPPLNAYTATIAVTSGSVGSAPTQEPPITLQKITAGTCVTVSANSTVNADTTCLVQKFFGTAAPGSVSGNLPGDLFSDTTNHNEYWCNATSGTAAPACTSVTTGGWTLLNGGGSGNTAPITQSTFTSSGSSATVGQSFAIPATKLATANNFANLQISLATGSGGNGAGIAVILATSAGATSGTQINVSAAHWGNSDSANINCTISSTGTNAQTVSCYESSNSSGSIFSQITSATLTTSAAIYVNIVVTGNGSSGDVVLSPNALVPMNW